jgi:hypothetical protein
MRKNPKSIQICGNSVIRLRPLHREITAVKGQCPQPVFCEWSAELRTKNGHLRGFRLQQNCNKTATQSAELLLSLSNSFSESGRGGIRTHGSRKATPDFESGTFNHSATLPSDRVEENSGKMENGKEAIETRKIRNNCGQLNGDRQFITM